MSSISTPWGYTYEYKRLTREEGEALIKKLNGRLLVEYQSSMDLETANGPYLLEDGQVVRIYDVSAFCYSSMKDYHCMRYGSDPILKNKHFLSNGPFQKIEHLPNGEKIFYTRLRKIDGQILIDVLPSIDLKRFPSVQSTHIELYLTADSEVLEFRKVYEDYNLYQDELDYQKCCEKKALANNFSFRVVPQLISLKMVGRNLYGEGFINRVDELAAQLPDILNLKNTEGIFNYKFSTLRKIEKILYRNVITDAFSDQIFLPLYAYYGKTFIKENSKYDYDIKWTLRQDDLYKTWIPDIQLNGHYLEIYDTILKMLDPEEDYRVSFNTILTRYK